MTEISGLSVIVLQPYISEIHCLPTGKPRVMTRLDHTVVDPCCSFFTKVSTKHFPLRRRPD